MPGLPDYVYRVETPVCAQGGDQWVRCSSHNRAPTHIWQPIRQPFCCLHAVDVIHRKCTPHGLAQLSLPACLPNTPPQLCPPPRSSLPLVGRVAQSLPFSPAVQSLADRIVQQLTQGGALPFNGAHLRLETDAHDWQRIMRGPGVRNCVGSPRWAGSSVALRAAAYFYRLEWVGRWG